MFSESLLFFETLVLSEILLFSERVLFFMVCAGFKISNCLFACQFAIHPCVNPYDERDGDSGIQAEGKQSAGGAAVHKSND